MKNPKLNNIITQFILSESGKGLLDKMNSISQEYQSRSDNSLFLGNTSDSSNVQRLNLLSNKFDKLVKTGQKKGLIDDIGSITTKGKYKQQSGRSRAFGDPINMDNV